MPRNMSIPHRKTSVLTILIQMLMHDYILESSNSEDSRD